MKKQDTEQLTLFPADSHASLSPWREGREDEKTKDFYGRKCFVLSENLSRLGFLVKTYLESYELPGNKYVRNWQVRDTLSPFIILKLRLSGRRIGETGSFLWGTPNAMDKLPRRGKESLEKMKNSTRKGSKYPSNLREQVDDEVMAFWRTPDAHCNRGAKSLETLKKKMNDGMPINLNDQTVHPTLWLTPMASEGVRAKFSKETLMKSTEKGSLSQEIAHNDKGKGGLNPLWVEQLMGFPVGWTEVCDAGN